jgi:hypothetical protein
VPQGEGLEFKPQSSKKKKKKKTKQIKLLMLDQQKTKPRNTPDLFNDFIFLKKINGESEPNRGTIYV